MYSFKKMAIFLDTNFIITFNNIITNSLVASKIVKLPS